MSLDFCDQTGRRSHETYAAAEEQQQRLVERYGYRGRVYRCRHCGQFHIADGRKKKHFRRRAS